jgi:hypothetical protein
MTIEELKALETKATSAPWPPVDALDQRDLPFGAVQLPWTTMPLEDYRLCQRLRNLAPEILALVEAVNHDILDEHGNPCDCSRPVCRAARALNTKLGAL